MRCAEIVQLLVLLLLLLLVMIELVACRRLRQLVPLIAQQLQGGRLARFDLGEHFNHFLMMPPQHGLVINAEQNIARFDAGQT